MPEGRKRKEGSFLFTSDIIAFLECITQSPICFICYVTESLDLNNLGFTGGVPNQWQSLNDLSKFIPNLDLQQIL